MKDENFLQASGMIILGLLSVVIGLLVIVLLIPQMNIAGGGFFVAAFLFLVVWLVVYIGLIISAMMVHFFGHGIGTSQARAAKRPPRKRPARK